MNIYIYTYFKLTIPDVFNQIYVKLRSPFDTFYFPYIFLASVCMIWIKLNKSPCNLRFLPYGLDFRNTYVWLMRS